MTSDKNSPWPKAIRRYIYRTIVLLTLFSLMAVGCHSWYSKSLRELNLTANDYHLSSNHHYLKAIEELRQLQTYYNQRVSNDKKPLSAFNSQINTSYYLIRQKIYSAINIEAQHADGQFSSITKKLEKELINLEKQHTQFITHKTVPDNIISNINELILTLKQIVHQHSIAHEKLQSKLALLRNQHEIIIAALLATLLILGFLTTRQGLKAIHAIIDEQQVIEQKVRRQAYYDSLTKIPNRLSSLDHLSQAISNAKRSHGSVSVMFLDLDNFKQINDSMGHDAGDKLLVETAQRLQNTIRDGDKIGRLGGDEFIIILGHTDNTSSIDTLAMRLIEEMKNDFVIGNRTLQLTVSIGISIYPKDGETSADILRSADLAMYFAKTSGRNTYSYFFDLINKKASRELCLEDNMRTALEKREFSVLYQPKIDLHSGKIIGAEALLRWRNPNIGDVPPEEFIPIAEQTGLISTIGEYVLDQALSATARWLNQYRLQFNIAVNLSPGQFCAPQLAHNIEKLLEHNGIAGTHLELEITEGALINGNYRIGQTLKNLNSQSIHLSMDNFGKGYSSLNHLSRHPFNMIKIDKSFIRDISNDSKTRELINAAISMAHALKIKVVAEGVETKEQLSHLQQLDCDYAQGYLFSKPIAEDEFATMLNTEKSRPFFSQHLQQSC